MTDSTANSRIANSRLTLQRLLPDAANYPTPLQTCASFKTAPVLTALGPLNLLQRPAVALFCSDHCPDELMPEIQQLLQMLHHLDLLPMSGFHTPVEQDWLKRLLDHTTPLIHCPARSLDHFRLSPQQAEAIEQNRLLVLSPFPASARRATVHLAARRNALVAALATAAVVAYATPNGKIAALTQQLIQSGKPVFTLKRNRVLLEMGAREVGEMGEVRR